MSCYNIPLTIGLLLENKKTSIKGYNFLALKFSAFRSNILGLPFLLFRPTGFGPTDQTRFLVQTIITTSLANYTPEEEGGVKILKNCTTWFMNSSNTHWQFILLCRHSTLMYVNHPITKHLKSEHSTFWIRVRFSNGLINGLGGSMLEILDLKTDISCPAFNPPFDKWCL